MNINEFARLILCSPHLQDKLFRPDEGFTGADIPLETEIPTRPERSSSLAFLPRYLRKRTPFPGIDTLADPSQRGLALHFFANHELLALELMAYAILRFQEAPPSFRLGLCGIIAEEQQHLSSYILRMQDFGVQFGDFPTNDFFWIYGCKAQTPLEFVSLVALTFEQANLDFALYYKDIFSGIEDAKTAMILEKVYQDEIGHVKHGLHWFQQWKAPDQSDFQVFSASLPAPLVPSRGKGPVFDYDGRRRAGLSEDFIQQMLRSNTSKSRPQNLYIFNLPVESASGKEGFARKPNKLEKEMIEDLEFLVSFLAGDKDMVALSRPASFDFIEKLGAIWPKFPEFLTLDEAHFWGQEACRLVLSRSHRLGKLRPWGFTPDVVQIWKNLPEKAKSFKKNEDLPVCLRGPYRKFSEMVSKDFARRRCGEFIENQGAKYGYLMRSDEAGQLAESEKDAFSLGEARLETYKRICFKSLYNSSGRGILRFSDREQMFDNKTRAWLQRELSAYGAILIEPWRKRIFDFSVLIDVSDKKESPLINVRQALVDERGQYLGHVLRGRGFGECLKFFNKSHEREIFARGDVFRELADFVSQRLLHEGYQGPASIDSYLYDRDLTEDEQICALQPISEINLRFTMGRVAHNFERHIAKNVTGLFAICDVPKESDALLQFKNITEAYFRQGPSLSSLEQKKSKLQLEQGLFFLTDPRQAHRKCVVLVIESDLRQCLTCLRALGLSTLAFEQVLL